MSDRDFPLLTSPSAQDRQGALSRLENGQQLNPTVNTLEVHPGIGKNLAFGMIDAP